MMCTGENRNLLLLRQSRTTLCRRPRHRCGSGHGRRRYLDRLLGAVHTVTQHSTRSVSPTYRITEGEAVTRERVWPDEAACSHDQQKRKHRQTRNRESSIVMPNTIKKPLDTCAKLTSVPPQIDEPALDLHRQYTISSPISSVAIDLRSTGSMIWTVSV